MKYKLLVILTVLAAGLAWGQSQTAMNDSAKKAFLAADKSLGTTLATVKDALTEEQAIKVNAAQTAWQAYRDACAESEAAQYTGGSIWPMVYYTSLEDLTKARIARLKAMLVDGGEVVEEMPAEEPMEEPAAEPAVNPVTAAMATEAVDTALTDANAQLAKSFAVGEYVKEILPTVEELPGVLATQGVEGDVKSWVDENPARAHEVVKMLTLNELQTQRKSKNDGFGDAALAAVVGYLRDQRKADGVTAGGVGALGAELVVKPLGAYRLYGQLKSSGYGKLLNDYVETVVTP